MTTKPKDKVLKIYFPATKSANRSSFLIILICTRVQKSDRRNGRLLKERFFENYGFMKKESNIGVEDFRKELWKNCMITLVKSNLNQIDIK